MKISGLSQSLDGGDFVVLMHDSKGQAGVHAPAVDVNRTGSALAVVTALLCAGQERGFAQAIQQSRARINLQTEHLAVDAQSDKDSTLNLRVAHVRALFAGQSF